MAKHERFRYYLHVGPDGLRQSEQTELETHLSDCALCRTYAAELAALKAGLGHAMRARWAGYSPSPDLSDRVPMRLQRKIRQDHTLNVVNAVSAAAVVVLIGALSWLLVQQIRPVPVIPVQHGVTASPPSPAAPEADAWPDLPGLSTFGGRFRLLGFALPAARLVPGDPVDMTLYWQTINEPAAISNIFVHLVGADGRLAAQADTPLAAGTCMAIARYSAGMIATCSSLLLPQGLSPGQYQLVVGIYDRASGQRLTTETGGSEVALTAIEIGVSPAETSPPAAMPTPALSATSPGEPGIDSTDSPIPPNNESKIVFASNSMIYTIDADDGELTPVAQVEGEMLCCPRWSPDRQQIGFGIGGGNYFGVYVVNADGSELKILTYVRRTDGDSPPLVPVWSQDGHQLEIVRGTYSVVEEDSSPDGQRIAFVGYEPEYHREVADLYVKNADGTAVTKLTTDPLRIWGIDW
jgi:hypothetical protein